jgi:RimJ/RimL family protein N-acetyltransferase
VRIQTERLLLRPPTIEDVDELVAIHAEPDVRRFMGDFDRTAALEWLTRSNQDWARFGYGRLAIVERASGRLLGRSGLKYWPEFGETEAGWVLRTDVWGHGFATEAARASVRWGFDTLDVPYLTAMIRPDNARSIAVAQRVRMRPLPDDVLLGQPVIVHSVTREQWNLQ